jgi:hypothetical protein
MGLKLNGTHQLLAYNDDVNLLADNIDTINENTILIDASKGVGPEINIEKTKYMLLSSPECRSKLGHKNSKEIVSKCVTVQIFEDYNKKSKLDLGGN